MTHVEVPDSLAQSIYDALAYKVKGSEHAARYASKKWGRHYEWDGIKSFFDKKNKYFLTGLLGVVVKALRDKGIPVEVVDGRQRPLPSPYASDFSLKGIELRDYQERVIDDFLGAKRGVARLATGAGKTEIAIALTKHLGLPTLFLTHRINLLTQTARRYVARCPELKNHIGVLGGGLNEPKRVTIATVQTLFAMIKKHPKPMAEFLSQFQFLVVDEAHRSGAKQFYVPASLCRNAYYRLALTATPFMGGDAESDMYLMGITADVISRVSNGELIERGILAKPLFKFFTVTEPDLSRFHDWRDVYERGIMFNASRNMLVASQTKKLTDMGKKTLVIVRECAHGELLTGLIKEQGVRTLYCDGRHSGSEREGALDALRKDRIDCIVATNIFDEGIDVHDINAIVLAAGTKSAPALFQRTGRAIRKKSEAVGNYAIIIDFIDDTHRILRDHSTLRYEMVKNEPGFTIL
jgi:superfamily II DNA or RNA helicase